MTDKELLKLAAKACGLEIEFFGIRKEICKLTNGKSWNPLTDKYDCLQMEIYLKLDIIWQVGSQGWAISDGLNGLDCLDGRFLAFNIDRQRASTMAAAEIGKGMK